MIDNVVIEGNLLNRKFSCDLLKCKGACCSLPGGRGAPLLDDEIEEIRSALPQVIPILGTVNKLVLEREDFFEGERGNYATTCIDDEDCVFVYRENGIAKCALEKAFNEGKTTFRKPISCHLYPIRVNKFGGDSLRYHEIPECRPAVKKGEDENTGVIEFLKSALVRQYGEEWYRKLESISNLTPVPARRALRQGPEWTDEK